MLQHGLPPLSLDAALSISNVFVLCDLFCHGFLSFSYESVFGLPNCWFNILAIFLFLFFLFFSKLNLIIVVKFIPCIASDILRSVH